MHVVVEDEAPEIITIDGRPWYQFSDRILPVISGGSDEGDQDDENEDDDDSDDSDDENDDADSDDDDSEDDEKEKAKKTEDESGFQKVKTDEWLKINRSNRRKNKENQKLREENKRLKALENAGGSEDEIEKAKAAEREATESVWKTRTVKQAARAAFAEAGVIGDPTKLVKLLEFEDIDVDDDGDIDGLDEQVAELKTEYPHLFKAEKSDEDEDAELRRRVKKSKNVDGGDKKEKRVEEKADSASLIAKVLTGAR